MTTEAAKSPKIRLFPVLTQSAISKVKDEDFSLPREYRGLKLEVQRSNDLVMSQSFFSPAKLSQQENFTCSPSLLQVKATVIIILLEKEFTLLAKH